MGGAAGGVGAALAQPGHQHVAGAGGDGQQRMVAPRTGVAVVAGALLGQTVGLADGGVQVNGQGRVAGSGAGLPGAGQQLAAHPVQLADVAPPEAAQEGAQGGGRLDYAAESAGRPAGAQRIGVVDAVAARQRRGHQRRNLIAGIGSAWRIAQVQAPVNQLGQTQVQGQGGRKDQPGIGDQAVVVEGDADAVGVVAWQHLLGAPFLGPVFCFKTIIPDAQEHLLAASGRRPDALLRWIRVNGELGMMVSNGLPPVHPGVILADELEALGLSANAASSALGVPTKRITAILKVQRGISADTALRLSRYLGTTPQLWLNLQMTFELRFAEIESGEEIKRNVQPREPALMSESGSD